MINQSFIIYEVVILNKNIFRLRLKNIFEREEKTSLILKNSKFEEKKPFIFLKAFHCIFCLKFVKKIEILNFFNYFLQNSKKNS